MRTFDDPSGLASRAAATRLEPCGRHVQSVPCAKRSLSSGNAPDQIADPLPDSLPEVPGTVLRVPETENWLYLCMSARRYSRARTSGLDARQHKGFVMKDRTGIW